MTAEELTPVVNRLPRFVRAFGGNQYHHVKRALAGRYLTQCDKLIGRWQVSNTPPRGLSLCAKCARVVSLEDEKAGGMVDKGSGNDYNIL